MKSLIFHNRPNELVITTDGRKVWISRSVAVVLVLAAIYKGKCFVAMGKRGLDCPDNIGKWCLPCGYLDFSENGWQAVCREAWEEIGFNLDGVRQSAHRSKRLISDFTDQPWGVKTEPNENRQNVSLKYGVLYIIKRLPRLISNNHGEGNEVSEAGWKTLDFIDEQANLGNIAFNHNNTTHDFLRPYKNDIAKIEFLSYANNWLEKHKTPLTFIK